MPLIQEILTEADTSTLKYWKEHDTGAKILKGTVTVYKRQKVKYNFHGEADAEVVEEIVASVKHFLTDKTVFKKKTFNKKKSI